MKNNLLIFGMFTSLVFWSPMVFAQEKTYTCCRLMQTPTMDGNVKEDPAWANIPAVHDFHNISTGQETSKPTFFRMGYTPDALYFGIECLEPDMSKIRSQCKDGGNLWDQDGIEIFLLPDNSSHYYHFIVDTESAKLNAIDDGYCSVLWNWQAAVYKGKDRYSMEIQIPFVVLNSLPEKNNLWHANVCRNVTVPQGMNGCWANILGSYHSPHQFGTIMFRDSILPNEGKETKAAIVCSLSDEILLNLKYSRPLKNFGSGKKVTDFERETGNLLSQIEKINQVVSLGRNISVSEAREIDKQSYDLLKAADDLNLKVGLNVLFDE